MSNRLDRALDEIHEASTQIFRGNHGGGYHLCDALRLVVAELDAIKKQIPKKPKKKRSKRCLKIVEPYTTGVQ